MRPARLNAWSDALTYFVESRDEAEWMREEDREPLALVREPAVAAGRSVRRRHARRAHPARAQGLLAHPASPGESDASAPA